MTYPCLVYGSIEHRVSDCLRKAIVVRDLHVSVVAITPAPAQGRGRGRGDGGKVDSSAMRSFILKDVARELRIAVETSRSSVTGKSPLGDSVVVDWGFYIILGMDWLSEHRAKVDCEAKLVTLCGAGGSEVVVGEKFELLSDVISSLYSEKLVWKGCEGYLAYILNTDSKEIRLEEIRTVCDFSYVFLKELLGLQLNREVEFSIKLYPSISLVSVAPYCMTPKELKELKLQLQELLDRGFIRLTGYYHCFVEGFSSIAAPLKKLLQKKTAFEWTDERYKCFEKLKLLLTEAFVLTKLVSDKEYVVYSDASYTRLGCVLMLDGRLFIPRDEDLRHSILTEVHSSHFAMHPGGNKMYQDLQRVKAEHKHPSGLLQPIQILEWKWEQITMDFVYGFLLTLTRKDSIWVDLRRQDIKYQISDKVFLKVSSCKKVLRFRLKGKLSPRFIGPYEKYISKHSHVVSFEEIEVQFDLLHEEELVAILNQEVKVLCN
ncbi:uncharacterized protein [Gossypium hirsutum]|uniref:Reverse transcriptase/retrotransposon-derived protein RNase H-like domain-containing protein n=1 Tax=Gossypium hirsutum TaxID=3635 RepID=A0A1U8PLJ4_GOSHI|nr:uncharacterized protein LOC107960266 [Gossypium hirsutum]